MKTLTAPGPIEKQSGSCVPCGPRPAGPGPAKHPLTETSTLQRIAAGDAAAVQECLDRFGGLVWSVARRFTYDAAEAEDAVQEVFVDVWKSAGRFDPERSSEAAFIAMIARRRLIDRRRKKERAPDSQSLELEPPSEQDTLERVEVCDEAERAVKAMAHLRPEQRKVIELSIYHGLTHEQISKTANMPLGTVKTHARRGLIRLRELLNEADAPEEVTG